MYSGLRFMQIKNIFCLFFAFVIFLSSISWASKNHDTDELILELESEYSEKTLRINDPLEPLNRFFFKINDRLYFYFFKPVAKGYSLVVPEKFRQGISRGFYNIRYPIRAINDILQFRLKNFLKETAMFVLNTTLGFGGLIEVSSGVAELASRPPEEDSGLTLGRWGVGHGFYLVLPILGPTTMRDGIGKIGDYFLDPLTYIEPAVSASLKGEDKLNYLSLHLGEYEDLKKSAIDPYVSFRNAYIQYRDSQLSK